MKFRLPPGANGIETETRFYPARGRRSTGAVIEVHDPKDQKLFKAADKVAGNLHSLDWRPVRTRNNKCVECGFNGWKYQKLCPCCNGKMEEQS